MRENKLLQALGRRVQALRKQKGWTQDELAGAVGKTVNAISNIERGVHSARIRTFIEIAGALDVAVRDLFDLPETQERAPTEEQRELSKLIALLETQDAQTIRRARSLLESALELGRGHRTRRKSK